MWLISRVDETLIGWNSTSTFESQKVTKLLVVGGDEKKDLVNGELCIFVSLVFFRLRTITLLWWFLVVSCKNAWHWVMYSCSWCWRYLGVYFALLFGQCKLWNSRVCCINWGVINALVRTIELSDFHFDIEIGK